MKKLLVLLAVLLASQMLLSQSQLESSFTTEGIETVTQNTEILIEEPLINKNKEKKDKNFLEDLNSDEIGMKIGVETVINGSGKSLNLPIKFRYGQFDFSSQIPYFFSKKMKYTLETAETSGLGDISVGAGYGSQAFTMFYYLHLDVKLPTGDDGKMEDGFLVPLGTGSTDFMLTTSVTKFITDNFSIGGGFGYKFNGSSSKIAEITRFDNPDDDDNTTDIESVDYTITNGNALNLNLNFDYYWDYGLSFNSDFSFKNIGDGNTDKEHSYNWNSETETLDGLSNKQAVTMLDLKATATYSISIFDISAGAKIPLSTERDENNKEDDREMGLFFKVDYTIF